MGGSRRRRAAPIGVLLAVAFVASGARAEPPAGERERERERSQWLFGMDIAYGGRFETDTLATRDVRRDGTARRDGVPAPSIGLSLGRRFASGLVLAVSGRFPPLVLAGQWAIGAGPGFETRLGDDALYLFGLAQIGYAGRASPFDQVGLDYAGPWTRIEAGLRYRLVEGLAPVALSVQDSRVRDRGQPALDVYVSFAIALDVVRAGYPALAQGAVPADDGWRLGPDASVGFGFLF
jgi:hypothetical protein